MTTSRFEVLHGLNNDSATADAGGDASATNRVPVDCSRVQAERERARARRARGIAISSQIFREACAKHRGGQAGVARALGVSKSKVNKWCDEHDDSTIPTHYLYVLAETCPSVHAEWKSRHDQQTKRDAPAALPATLHETLHHVRSEVADADRLLAPGANIASLDLARIDREAQEAHEATAQLVAHVRALRAAKEQA